MARKKKVLYQQQTAPVGPQTEALKTRFREKSIPLDTDFAALIDVADCGRRATGQSPDFDPADNTGLMLDENRQLKVLADAGITVSDSGVGVLFDPYQGIDVSASGITVKANTAQGIGVTASGVYVRVNNARGISVDSNGVGMISSTRLLPVGSIIMWPSDTLPDGWLWCNGDSHSGSLYPRLASLFGVPTTGTFQVPDFAGRYPVGCGSESSNTVNTQLSARTGMPDGFKVTLTGVGDHTHKYLLSNVTETAAAGADGQADDVDSTLTTSAAGAHTHTITANSSFPGSDTLPESLTVNFIIAHD